MKTAIVILNCNTCELLARFLPSVIKSIEVQDACVIVVDNGSTDKSIELLRSEFPTVRTIELGDNYGFTGGYDKALEQVDAEYFMLLNSDVEVPRAFLAPLTEYLDQHPECGICGPKLLQLPSQKRLAYSAPAPSEHPAPAPNESAPATPNRFEYAGAAGGMIDALGFPFCRGRVLSKVVDDRGQYDQTQDVTWVSGAALMIRSSLWRQLGGFDSRFFAHMEEIDLCWRAQTAGYKVTVVPSSEVYHLGGGTLSPKSPKKLYLNYRNNLLMLDNNLPAKSRGVITLRYCIDILAAIAYLLTFNAKKFKAVIKAHSDYRKLKRSQSEGKKVNLLSRTLVFIEYFKLK